MSLQDEAVPRKQLHHIVSERLRAAILDGTFQPGEWLRQNRIAKELGVSQMPVREALKELAAEGLVEHIPYRGVRVLEFSQQDVADLYTHRAFLEGITAKAAAQHITSEELDEMKALAEQMQENLADDHLPEYRRLNRDFHQVMCEASRRNYLIRTLNQMWSAFPTMLCGNFAQTADCPLPERNDNDLEEHRAIIDALEKGDAEQAKNLVKEHIDAARKQLLSVLDSQQ